MSSAIHQWEIVCPDGQVRHLPYINEDDATFDMMTRARRCDFYPDGRALDESAGACPQGEHTARRAAETEVV